MREPSGWATHTAPVAPPPPRPEDELLDTTPTGPTGPIPGVTPPPAQDQLPILHLPSRTTTTVWWVGVHGGSGASTLAALDDPTTDCSTHGWPTHPDGQDVVVVARETAQGLAAATAAARHYASGEIPARVLALVTVPAMRGKLPGPLAAPLRLVAGCFPIHYRTEWHPEYMLHPDPRSAPADRATVKVIRTIHQLQKGNTHGHP